MVNCTFELLVIFFLGVLTGVVMMILLGMFLKSMFTNEAERRKRAQPFQQTIALDLRAVKEGGLDAALRERAKKIASLN